MARKKQEVALQLEVNTQEEWEEIMQKDGLFVVDVYQDWCGPCKALLTFFRRIKNEIGDEFLNFVVAKSDTIDSLEKYRGKCEPCFLLYGGGSLVNVIRGANPPKLEEIIKTKLGEEHKIMSGEIERKEYKDPFLADVEVEEKVTEEEYEEVEKEVTLALIKPDIVRANKVDEIIKKLEQHNIEILAHEERSLSEEEARSFYHHMSGEEFFESLITFITSGPSHVLVLAKEDGKIISEFRELIGPKIVEEAKTNAPESLRAIYGSSSIENAIHGAEDEENAERELAFFFPDFVKPKISRKKAAKSSTETDHKDGYQRTLALIRPAAYEEFKDSILEKINSAGFNIVMQKEVQMSKEDAELFYKEHKDGSYFEELTTEMSKGTLLALALEKQNAISNWRGMLGPKNIEEAKESDPNSLRAQFAKDDLKINLIHGSDSVENAQEELTFFFPIEQTIAAIKPDGLDNRDEIISKIREARFHIAKKKDIVLTQEIAEQFYQDNKDAEYYNELIEHMISGPTLFLVLSRQDAIRGWRSLMGPKDPVNAEESYPDCLRAIYGKDITKNAVYGSDNKDEVIRVMELIFGTLEFNDDGTLLPEYQDPESEEESKEVTTSKEQGDAEESANVEHTEASGEAEEAQTTKDSPEDEETKADETIDAEPASEAPEGETTEPKDDEQTEQVSGEPAEETEAVSDKQAVETEAAGETEGESGEPAVETEAVSDEPAAETENKEPVTEDAGEDVSAPVEGKDETSAEHEQEQAEEVTQADQSASDENAQDEETAVENTEPVETQQEENSAEQVEPTSERNENTEPKPEEEAETKTEENATDKNEESEAVKQEDNDAATENTQ